MIQTEADDVWESMENEEQKNIISQKKEDFHINLRPQYFNDYVGQKKLKALLRLSIEAANQRGDVLDHILLYGPPGLGKTTLAGIIANEMGTGLKITSGPSIEKPGELAAVLNGLNHGDILFIDEIHRLSRQVEEVLYPAMEDFAIDVMIGKDASARSIRLELPKFTLIGATTRAGMLSAPLRDRFGITGKMEYYTENELEDIICQSASFLQIDMDKNSARQIAKRSRGTPRIANRYVKRVRDYAQVKNKNIISPDCVKNALEQMEVDQHGLNSMDRIILRTIHEYYQDGPVGLNTLCASIGEDCGTVEDVYEPYLIKNGYLSRTARGRMLTDLGKKIVQTSQSIKL